LWWPSLRGEYGAICTAQEAYREIHKDIVLLVLLSLLAVGLFLAAKAMATSEKEDGRESSRDLVLARI